MSDENLTPELYKQFKEASDNLLGNKKMKNIEKIIELLAFELRHSDECQTFHWINEHNGCIKCQIEDLIEDE